MDNWIPISERLPKAAGVYRVTRYLRHVKHYLVDACYFDGSDTWYDDNRINHGRHYVNNVIAWQENPEPYKPESRSNTPELKPCPFCGTEVELRREPLWNGSHGYHGCFKFAVKCPKCGCSVDYIDSDTIYRSEEEAIANVTKAWNERYTHWFERAKESEE